MIEENNADIEKNRLAKLITFCGEGPYYDELNHLLHKVPERFEYGKLERKAEGDYRCVQRSHGR